MRKKILLGSAVVLVLTVGSSVALAETDVWGKLNKKMGLVKVQEGTLINTPTIADKDHFVKSIDPATGMFTRKLTASAHTVPAQSFEKTINFNLDGYSTILDFEVISEKEKSVVVQKTENGYHLTPLPHSNRYLLTYKHSIYLLDVNTDSISKLLNDSVGTFSKTSTVNDEPEDDFVLVWGINPNPNPSGQKFLFNTNRNVQNDKDNPDELWIKDLSTNEEKPLLKGNVKILGWENDQTAIVLNEEKTYKLDVDSGRTDLIFEESNDVYYSSGYVMKKIPGSLLIINAATGEELNFEPEGLGELTVISTSPNGSRIAVLNRPDVTKYDTNIYLIDLSDLSYNIIPSPPNANIDDVSWYTDEELVVNTHKTDGTATEESYIINIKDLEV